MPDRQKQRRPPLWSWAALLWGLAEGFLFFVVPDVIISGVALSKGLRAGLIACLLAAAGAGLGGGAMYVWSQRDPAAALSAVAAIPSVSDAMIAQARTDIARDGWLVAALKGPMSSTPYKVYAMLAPSSGASLPAWMAAAFPVRLPRFIVVALAFALARRLAQGRISRRGLTILFSAGWVLFYGWFWAVHPS
ncbi:hypothetical protein QO010_004615 [Caulobacter ginsengisoli]|uniref:DedA family protein n=1 Tax=Caulobacter ginsengisoli TaxID=400775 RepID=A0ABU0IXU3_9CAUL|nr:hypothetical protein [Caulobacter ginsengisoli]MDQ0466819.1 hypothetical protein [Caulobacter ginsengisoli]